MGEYPRHARRVLLVNVDCRWNLAIRRMRAYYENMGASVDVMDLGFSFYPHKKATTVDGNGYDFVAVSNIFDTNAERVTVTGCENVIYGGVGSKNPAAQLPDFIEETPYSVVSYFCGCGGLDLGFRGDFDYHGKHYGAHPFTFFDAYDFNENAVDTYNRYFGENRATVLDLAEADIEEIPKAQILIGGFPCQEFSSCGPLGGLDSERGQLYKTLVKYMAHYRPMMVVGENVINLERMNGGQTMKTIVDDFEAQGYRFEVWKFNAPDYGVPQNRQRLFFIGVRDDLPGFPEKPEPHTAKRPHTIKWAIGDLEAITDESVPNQSQYFKASKAKRGNGQGDEVNRANEPAYTIRANPKSRVQFHYSLERRLTVRECARIQTFPDDFYFPHSMTTSMFEIGNAVPPVLAHQVADSVAKFMDRLKKEGFDA